MQEIKTITRDLEITILKEIGAAIKRLGMYPSEHPAATKATEKPFFTLQELFKETNQVIISQVDEKIIVNGKSITGDSLPERLREEFEEQDINSLTLFNTLTKGELGKFLNFFVKPLERKAAKRSLVDFLSENKIGSIQVNELKYELVSDDEVVVKSDVLEGTDLKAQISEIIKQNPDLVREVLLKKPLGQKSCKEKLGTEVNLGELTQGIHQQLKNLTDDEVLALLASGLEFTLKKSKGERKHSAMNQAANLVHQLLQDRERKKLLPEVKKMLSGSGLLEEKYFDFVFDQKWLKSQAVLDELIGMVENLGKEKVDFERFMFLLERVIDSEEEKIRLYAVEKLLSNLHSENGERRRLSVSALREILSRSISDKMQVEFVYYKEKLGNMIGDPLLPVDILKDAGELIKMLVLETMQRKEFEQARGMISEYGARLSPDVSYTDEVREVARDFLREVSDEATLSLLTSQLGEGRPVQNTKVIEEILESLDKEKVAQELIKIFTVDDRATRMSSLRILSKLGQSSIAALSGLLSNVSAFSREEGTHLLADEHWYKVRNAIYVLGNIPDRSSVEVLVRLNSDPDERVKLEAIRALEKIGGEESVDALLSFLKDADDQVRRNAITSLSTLRNGRCLNSLVDHFHYNRKDKVLTLTTIGKIGGSEVTELLLKSLSEEEPGMKHLPNREKEEIKIAALNVLEKIGSVSSSPVEITRVISEIEKVVRQNKKGIRGFFVKDAMAERAERVLKVIKDRTRYFPSSVAMR